MKYCIRIYYKGGFSYLWHRDKNAWSKDTATKYMKYMNEWNARNPGSPAELEEQQ